ncbi:hypothetical protein FJZ28_03110 [Candidatus Peregrinibacteria bacterium]|nr:hypothetical protein [Candidatus Peregrinibacteria bacterium]
MFPLFHFSRNPSSPFGGGLLFNGLLCVFFGLAILAAPELLAYFVATVLLFFGATMLTMWWKVRNMR